MNYDSATGFCAGAGARLCSHFEILSGNFNMDTCAYQRVWTSTQCAGGFVTMGTNVVKTQTYAVRCSDTAVTYPPMCCTEGNDLPAVSESMDRSSMGDKGKQKSTSTCKDLGWDATSKGSFKVCAASNIKGMCNPSKTYIEAERICSAVGARLCTTTELENDETQGTGCQFDFVQIWASDSCTLTNGYAGFMAAAGSSLASGLTPSCYLPRKRKFAVRCCADAGPSPPSFPPSNVTPTYFQSSPAAQPASSTVLFSESPSAALFGEDPTFYMVDDPPPPPPALLSKIYFSDLKFDSSWSSISTQPQPQLQLLTSPVQNSWISPPAASAPAQGADPVWSLSNGQSTYNAVASYGQSTLAAGPATSTAYSQPQYPGQPAPSTFYSQSQPATPTYGPATQPVSSSVLYRQSPPAVSTVLFSQSQPATFGESTFPDQPSTVLYSQSQPQPAVSQEAVSYSQPQPAMYAQWQSPGGSNMLAVPPVLYRPSASTAQPQPQPSIYAQSSVQPAASTVLYSQSQPAAIGQSSPGQPAPSTVLYSQSRPETYGQSQYVQSQLQLAPMYGQAPGVSNSQSLLAVPPVLYRQSASAAQPQPWDYGQPSVQPAASTVLYSQSQPAAYTFLYGQSQSAVSSSQSASAALGSQSVTYGQPSLLTVWPPAL